MKRPLAVALATLALAGAKLTWTVAPLSGGQAKSGELVVDKNGLATAQKLTIGQEKAKSE